MLTVNEYLQKAREAIVESDALLRNSDRHKTEMQTQIDYTRKVIAESLAMLREATARAPE